MAATVGQMEKQQVEHGSEATEQLKGVQEGSMVLQAALQVAQAELAAAELQASRAVQESEKHSLEHRAALLAVEAAESESQVGARKRIRKVVSLAK